LRSGIYQLCVMQARSGETGVARSNLKKPKILTLHRATGIGNLQRKEAGESAFFQIRSDRTARGQRRNEKAMRSLARSTRGAQRPPKNIFKKGIARKRGGPPERPRAGGKKHRLVDLRAVCFRRKEERILRGVLCTGASERGLSNEEASKTGLREKGGELSFYRF